MSGLAEHRAAFGPSEVVATEPLSWRCRRLLEDHDVRLVRSNQFLCHYEDFAAWASDQTGRLTMENFYRWRRRQTGYLMDGEEPSGGRWNFDAENRQAPPRKLSPAEASVRWPPPPRSRLDDTDREVLGGLPESAFGDEPDGTWSTSRRAALFRLRHVVEVVLPRFGPHEDAMTEQSWHLAHSLLSPALNLGLLLPGEVLDAAEAAYRDGSVPLASAEGFIRQILGGASTCGASTGCGCPSSPLRTPWATTNRSQRRSPIRRAPTCDASAMRSPASSSAVWVHHIQRLMVIANLTMLLGVRPPDVVEWMWASFVDGQEWVYGPPT